MKHAASRRLVVAATLLAALGALDRAAVAATYSDDQKPQVGEKIAPQHYRFYIPDGVAVVRALIIHQHGCGRGDWNTGWDVHWQALADKWDAALVSPWLEGDCANWYNPANGSWRALGDALKNIGDQSGHPELVNAPFSIWGHSGGGDWVAQMMRQHPTRIIAAVSRSGGNDPGAAADGIPALVVRGSDTDIGTDVRRWFASARPRGALVAMARDLDQWHDCADLRVLAIPFLDAVMAQRLPPPTTGPVTLAPASAQTAWLGDAASFQIAAAVAFAGDKMTAHWLPNQAIAQKWSEFANPQSPHKTGWSTDTTAPDSAPWDLGAVVMGGSVALSWQARADLDTGIKSFTIYRDGVRTGSLGGKAGTANMGGGFFQWGAFGDEASPGPTWPNPPPRWPFPAVFTDPAAPDGAHQYQVAIVNGQGLEGPRSVAIPVTAGAGTDSEAPTVSIASPVAVAGGATGRWAATVPMVALSGSAADNVAVVAVVWSNNRGGSGKATGTTTWMIPAVALTTGVNTIHVTAYDGANHATTATLLVGSTVGAAPAPPPPSPADGGAGGSVGAAGAGGLAGSGRAGASGAAGAAGSTPGAGTGGGPGRDPMTGTAGNRSGNPGSTGVPGGAGGASGAADVGGPDAASDAGCACRVGAPGGASDRGGFWVTLAFAALAARAGARRACLGPGRRRARARRYA
jgi:hypothetical protein